MIKCPICGKALRIDFGTDMDHDRGYYATCDDCNLYFGLDDDMRDLGYFCGAYADEQAVIREYEKLVNGRKG